MLALRAWPAERGAVSTRLPTTTTAARATPRSPLLFTQSAPPLALSQTQHSHTQTQQSQHSNSNSNKQEQEQASLKASFFSAPRSCFVPAAPFPLSARASSLGSHRIRYLSVEALRVPAHSSSSPTARARACSRAPERRVSKEREAAPSTERERERPARAPALLHLLPGAACSHSRAASLLLRLIERERR